MTLETVMTYQSTPSKLALTLRLKSSLTIKMLTNQWMNDYKHIISPKFKNYNLNTSIAAYISCNIAATITSPLWVIRQKIQLDNKFSLLHFYKNGAISQYRSLPPLNLLSDSGSWKSLPANKLE